MDLSTLFLLLTGAIVAGFVQGLSGFAFSMVTYIATGLVTTAVLPYFALILPAMLVPTLLGTRIYKHISDSMFRTLVLSLLTCSGLALLSSALPQLLA